MDNTYVYDRLYTFITKNGARSPADALRRIETKPTLVQDDLHAGYGPYGSNWAHSDKMPTFELALQMLRVEIAERLREEI